MAGAVKQSRSQPVRDSTMMSHKKSRKDLKTKRNAGNLCVFDKSQLHGIEFRNYILVCNGYRCGALSNGLRMLFFNDKVTGFCMFVHCCCTLLLFVPGNTGAGMFLSSRDSATVVYKTGAASYELTDKESRSRNDAVEKAILELIDKKIQSQFTMADQQALFEHIFSCHADFVKSITEDGDAVRKDDQYVQRYRVEIIPAQLDKVIVESVIQAGIDTPLIYKSIERPRIALAVNEINFFESGKSQEFPHSATAESSIQNYFAGRNADFEFVSLDALKQSVSDPSDWVAMGRKNKFDILITGSLYSRHLYTAKKTIGGISHKVSVPLYRFSSAVDWTVINVGRAERVCTVSTVFDKGNENNTSEHAAYRYAQEQVLKKSLPDLFKQIMLNWLDCVYYAEYDIVIVDQSGDKIPEIRRLLESTPSIMFGTVQPRGNVDGEMVFNVRVQGTLDTLIQDLTDVFSAHSILESRVGKILLSAKEMHTTLIRISINNCSFSKSLEINQELTRLSGVLDVSSPDLQGGQADFVVQSTLPVRRLAALLEQNGARVTGLTDHSIQAMSIEQ